MEIKKGSQVREPLYGIGESNSYLKNENLPS